MREHEMQQVVLSQEQIAWVKRRVSMLKKEGRVEPIGQEAAAHNFVSSLLVVVPKLFPNAQRFRIEGFRMMHMNGGIDGTPTREDIDINQALGMTIHCVKVVELPAPSEVYRLYHVATAIGGMFLYTGMMRADNARAVKDPIRFRMMLRLGAEGKLCMEVDFLSGSGEGMTFYAATLVGLKCAYCGSVDFVPQCKAKTKRTAVMRYCNGCLLVFGRRVPYCTPECQRDDWAVHRMSCGGTDDKGRKRQTHQLPSALGLLRTLVADSGEATRAFEREVEKEMTGLNTNVPFRIFQTNVIVLVNAMGSVTRSLVDEIPWLMGATVLSFTRRGDVNLIVLHALYAMNVRLFVRVLRGSHVPVEVFSDSAKSIDLFMRCEPQPGVEATTRTDLILAVVLEEACLVCGVTAKGRMAGVRFLSCKKCLDATEAGLPTVLYCSRACMAENADHHALVCGGLIKCH